MERGVEWECNVGLRFVGHLNDKEMMTLIEYKTRECVYQDKHKRFLFQVLSIQLTKLTENESFNSYVQVGAMAIKLILRNFAPVIKSNMAAPPVSVGVDLVREERWVKNLSKFVVLNNFVKQFLVHSFVVICRLTRHSCPIALCHYWVELVHIHRSPPIFQNVQVMI